MTVADALAPTLRTPNLHLRLLDPALDAEPLHGVFGDAGSLRYMLRAPCASVAETAALLEKWGEDRASPQWAIVDEARTVGRITLVYQRAGVFEVGVQVVPGAQGRGVATQAIVAVTRHALEHLEAGRVYADIDPDNARCLAAFRRAGFRFEGTLRANWQTPQGTFDSDIYAATAGWEPPA